MIEFDRLSKTWPDGTRALSDISLAVPRGQFCVVLGPSGAGKSTLLRAVNGLMRPTTGRVAIDGIDLTPASERELRRRVAMIHQHFNLTARMSVAGNVLAGLLPVVSTGRALLGWFTPAHRARACALLAGVGLDPRHLRRRAGELSGGQQQRVGIVRALALRPQLLLFDEPTSALDPELVGDVLTVIKELADEGWTMVVVTHELAFARQVADEVIFMDGGVVVERGHPDTVLRDPQEERTRQFVDRLLNPF
jgi:phosphonate transport system ATP-binding protein